MEAGRDEDGRVLVDALVAEGDRDATWFWAGENLYSDNPTLRAQALSYGRQFALSGDRLWVDSMIRMAAEEHEAGPIIELRCALKPRLQRRDMAIAELRAPRNRAPSDEAWFATVAATAMTSEPALHSVPEGGWTDLESRLRTALPWLDVEHVLFETCPTP
jgi:hypothetical protein